MKFIERSILLLIAIMIFPLVIFSQPLEETKQQKEYEINPLIKTLSRLERKAFDSAELIDNQTDNVYKKGTLEFVMNHRFGLVNGDPMNNDLLGIWGPANIRLAVGYSVTNWAKIGYGTTKDNRLQDFNLKLVLLKQTRDNKLFVNISYFGNYTIDARPKENFQFTSDRFSFFNQLIISRRINRSISFLISPSVSHFNLVETNESNDIFALGSGIRYKLTPQTAITIEYTQAFNVDNNIQPGIATGFEFVTGSHAFQVFITNYRGIIPQRNIVYNQNKFFDKDFMIGFNINRLWNL